MDFEFVADCPVDRIIKIIDEFLFDESDST